MITIVDIQSTQYTTDTTNHVRAELIGDTVADLPTPTGISGYTLLQGSTCKIIADSSLYQMQSDGTWSQQLQTPTADTYTRAQIDAMISAETAARQAADNLRPTTAQVFGVGTQLTTGEDLNNKTALGIYSANTGTIAQSLYNCPTTRPFRLEVTTLNGSTRFVQTVIDTNTTSQIVSVFIRTYTQNGWTNWQQFNMSY